MRNNRPAARHPSHVFVIDTVPAGEQAGAIVASPLVSIVTPAHNAEPHLGECIESVLRQTYKDWEYVVVDNCSSDRTSEIVESFAKREPRIRLERHEEFVDVVASYNRAYAAVDPGSTYTKAVGADDWLDPECLERMVVLAEANPAVGIVSAYRLDGDTVTLKGLPPEKEVVPGRAMLRQSLLGGPYVTGSATSVLLRSDLVCQRRPFYDPSFRHADTEAAYWALSRTDFGLVHRVLTFTRRPAAGETPLSTRVGTYLPENIRMLIRYGPQVLAQGEYRRHLHRSLATYGWWLFKQRLKSSRRADRDFHTFHRRVIDLIGSDGAHEREIGIAASCLRAVLGRRV